jgi:hypothetical protein
MLLPPLLLSGYICNTLKALAWGGVLEYLKTSYKMVPLEEMTLEPTNFYKMVSTI